MRVFVSMHTLTISGKRVNRIGSEMENGSIKKSVNRSVNPSPPQEDLCLAYETALGRMFHGDSSKALKYEAFKEYRGKINLIFTSPPFPLNSKRKYGNLNGNDYLEWLVDFAPSFREILADDGALNEGLVGCFVKERVGGHAFSLFRR